MRIKLRGSTTLYILDLFCTFFAVGLLGFCIYIFPYVFLGYENYSVPQYVVDLATWYQDHHQLSGTLIALLMFMPLIIAAICFFFIARLISFYIETHEAEPGVPHVDEEDIDEHIHGGRQRASGSKVSWTSTFGIIALITALLLALVLSEYFLLTSIIV